MWPDGAVWASVGQCGQIGHIRRGLQSIHSLHYSFIAGDQYSFEIQAQHNCILGPRGGEREATKDAKAGKFHFCSLSNKISSNMEKDSFGVFAKRRELLYGALCFMLISINVQNQDCVSFTKYNDNDCP